jgi:ABC-2 type transport system permease protein
MNFLIWSSEFKNIMRETLMPILLVIIFLFTSFAFYNGYQWTVKQNQVIGEAQIEQQQSVEHAYAMLEKRKLADNEKNSEKVNWWEDVTDIRGYAFYLMTNYAVKSPLASAPIAVGQSDIFPYFFQMQVANKQGFIHKYEYLHPLLLSLGKFDLAFFIIYILPLLLIAINFNALALEKHSGQLRLQMLQGISPQRLLFNQLLVRSLVILVPFLILMCALLGTISTTTQTTMYWQQLMVLSLLVLGYAAFWVALSALLISKGKTAAHNASGLISCWLAFVVVLPALINTGINISIPAPSRVVYLDTLRAATDDIKKASAKTLANYFQDHPELAKSNANDNSSNSSNNKDKEKPVDFSVKTLATINAVEQVMQPLDNAFTATLLQQQNLAERLKYLSPATILQSSLYELSGNGLTRHQDFIRQVTSYHEGLRQFFQQRIVSADQNSDFTPCAGCNARITLDNFTDLPRFTYQMTTQTKTWPAIGLLFLAVGILLFFASVRLKKYV